MLPSRVQAVIKSQSVSQWLLCRSCHVVMIKLQMWRDSHVTCDSLYLSRDKLHNEKCHSKYPDILTTSYMVIANTHHHQLIHTKH